MTVLHIDSGREMRGGQWQVLYLMRGLRDRGIASRLLTRTSSPLKTAAQAEGFDVLPFGLGALGGADLIHAHDARSHTLALVFGKPLIVSRRVAFPVARSAASRLKYKRPARFLAVSQCVKQTLVTAGVDASSVDVVYDGVPIPASASGTPRDGVVALDLDDPRKGRELVRKASELSGISVRFTRNLPDDVRTAAVFLYITESEGLGSAALLAMAAGTPVIASNTGGLREVIQHGISGLLTSNEPAAIAEALNRMVGDPQLASSCAATARIRVENCFSIDRMVESTIRAYQQVLR